MYAMRMLYSDIIPHTIIKETGKKIRILHVQACRCEQTKAPTITPGGFAGHARNHEQRWDIQDDPQAAVIKIRQHKDGRWMDANGNHYVLDATPVKFYDYNF